MHATVFIDGWGRTAYVYRGPDRSEAFRTARSLAGVARGKGLAVRKGVHRDGIVGEWFYEDAASLGHTLDDVGVVRVVSEEPTRRR